MKLLHYYEQQAVTYGFSKTEMMATLSGVKLYQAQDYISLSTQECLLPNGVSVKFIHMRKIL